MPFSLPAMLAFLMELLLYSGQYGMFYLLLNFVHIGFFTALTEPSHLALLVTLVIQCSLLSRFGENPKRRFLLTLLLPVVYTIVEFLEAPAGIWNMGHVFFWIFSLTTGSFHSLALWGNTRNWRMVSESAISFSNIGVFAFTYFYFDLLHDWEIAGFSGTELREKLSIANFPSSFQVFLADRVHTFFIVGMIVLAFATALARSRILHLQDRVTELMGTYVDASVRDKILDTKTKRLISQKKIATVLFCDIRGFTAMSERTSPEELIRFLNGYFSLWDGAVKRHGGWIDKFIGDAVMVVFDTGTDSENTASALGCAEEIFQKLPGIRTGIFSKWAIGVGIHSGDVIAGDIGSATRRNYTVIGDTVNTASRLEGLCKENGAELIVSETVYEASDHALFPMEFLGETAIRGKEMPMRIYGRKNSP